MQKSIKVYVAGKVSPNSHFQRHDWREDFCEELSKKSGLEIINLDPTKSSSNFNLDESDSRLIFGRDCFMIKSADLVMVHLTDDISVGGSQEMLIAKYFGKPLIGIAPLNGKFRKKTKTIRGRTFENWTHPFVNIPCDEIVQNIDDAADCLKHFISANDVKSVKNISIIDKAIEYYENNHYHADQMVKSKTSVDK